VKTGNLQIKMGTGFSAVLVFEAILICIVSFISINLFYQRHTELLYNESAEVLNLYFTRVEDRLREVENLWFSILSDLTIQEHFNNINQYGDSYGGYMAQQEAKNKLLYKLFLIEGIDSIEYITNTNQIISAGYAAASHTWDEMNAIKEIAYRTYGTGTWETNLSGKGSVSFVRLIRDITKTGFKPLGTLVINIDADNFMSYSSVISSKFHSNILIMAGSDLIYSAGQHPVNVNMLSEDDYSPYRIKAIDGINFFITERKTDYVDWRFISMIRCDELLSDINNLKTFVFIIFILSVIVSIGIGFKFAGLITRTLVRLSGAMKHVERDDYDVVLSEPHGKLVIDEVLQLQNEFNIMAKRIDFLINDVLKKEIKIREFQYKMLQQQINPHFLYNTLDTIYWMAKGVGSEKISNMVRSLSDMFRGSLEHDDIISLKDEARILQDYITVQKLRFEERLDFSMEIDERYLNLLIPKITLQPIVENSINYSLEKYEGVCRIRVKCRENGDIVEIDVSDNGPGMEEEFIRRLMSGQSKPRKTGIGLKNIDERLKLLYGHGYGICIQSSLGSGTTVTIRIPKSDHVPA